MMVMAAIALALILWGLPLVDPKPSSAAALAPVSGGRLRFVDGPPPSKCIERSRGRAEQARSWSGLGECRLEEVGEESRAGAVGVEIGVVDGEVESYAALGPHQGP